MLSHKERTLLNYLRENSRLSLAEVSRQTNMPISTLWDVMRRLEGGVVKKYTSLLVYSELGYGLRVNFVVHSREEGMITALFYDKSVNSILKTSEHDYLIESIFRDLKELSEFRERMEGLGIDTIYQNFILEELKKEKFLVEQSQ